MTYEEKIMFQQWIDMNGGKEGSLYMTFPDEELEQIFLTSITICKKDNINLEENKYKKNGICKDKNKN